MPASCPANEPCEVPVALSATGAAQLLGNRPETWWLNGDILTVVARREGEATLCCAIQQPLHPIGGGLQTVSVRVPDIASAILDILVIPPVGETNLDPVWRGSRAPPVPDRSDIAEVSTTNHTIDSAILHQSRDIFVYVPPGLAAGQRVPVIYVADGLLDNFTRIADAAIRKGRAAPVILVGIVPGTGPAVCPEHWCTARNREYLVDIPNPAIGRFDVQDRFVTEEVIPFVESHYPALPGRDARAIMGQSAGGAWAVTMAARHPDLFSKAIAFSVAWEPAARQAGGLRRIQLFLAAGRMEGEDRLFTMEADRLARGAGADVRLTLPNSGHSMGTWETGFAEALPWLFPPAAGSR